MWVLAAAVWAAELRDGDSGGMAMEGGGGAQAGPLRTSAAEGGRARALASLQGQHPRSRPLLVLKIASAHLCVLISGCDGGSGQVPSLAASANYYPSQSMSPIEIRFGAGLLAEADWPANETTIVLPRAYLLGPRRTEWVHSGLLSGRRVA